LIQQLESCIQNFGFLHFRPPAIDVFLFPEFLHHFVSKRDTRLTILCRSR
jgi:hypothetical protein